MDPLDKLLQHDDEIQPIVVSLEDSPNKGPLHVGFRIAHWGGFFRLTPTVCWREKTNQEMPCEGMEPQMMYRAQLTATHAIADILTESLVKRSPSLITFN